MSEKEVELAEGDEQIRDQPARELVSHVPAHTIDNTHTLTPHIPTFEVPPLVFVCVELVSNSFLRVYLNLMYPFPLPSLSISLSLSLLCGLFNLSEGESDHTQ